MWSKGVLALDNFCHSTRALVCVVYVCFLLDNVLLTMVVPIIPDFLVRVDSSRRQVNLHSNSSKSTKPGTAVPGLEAETYIFDLESENGRMGLLLSSKAFVQLLLNPFVGTFTARVGYQLPLFIGSITLLASTLLFAAGESYATLFAARSLQGVASACIGVTGMSLIADRYPTEPSRSRMMGFILGSVAVGVLLGYPFGGFMYDFLGKPTPFIIVGFCICLNSGFQLYSMDVMITQQIQVEDTGWLQLLSDKFVLLTGGAIGISTSAMAILEPCLPIWLMVHIRPKKWQLGTAFIPDSIGYVVGTNVFGSIAYQAGRSKVAVVAMVVVGMSSVMIPLATTVMQLIFPHFLLGLGIGVVDAALVPLLASIVDTRHSAHYGSVYALQQMAVSLAYSLGPMVGGEVVRKVGFPWLMRVVGFINIAYSVLLLRLELPVPSSQEETSSAGELAVQYHGTQQDKLYQRFVESDDSD